MAWLVCLAIATAFFGLNWDVWAVSQLKGLVLSVYVLLVIWPALFLYMLVDDMGGMSALVISLESIFTQRELLWLVLAWTFSGLVEGLTGFGLPVAIVAPMLVGIGVEPVLAVAVVAVGHAWAVTFGSMGLGLQTLGAVTQMDPALLAPASALLLAAGGLGCGLAVMFLLKQGRHWLMVGLSTMMDHCGMTQLLAHGLAQTTGPIFPLVSPMVGMLGTFTTGSNNNSNVLLAPLQKNVALLLKMDPRLLVSGQTAGGSLGSMTAPAKIVVGCGTVGIIGRDGEVLKKTLPYGLAIGLGVGLLTLLLLAFHF